MTIGGHDVTPADMRELRESWGLGYEDFGQLCGTHGQRTVRRWEAGERAIPGCVKQLLWLIQQLAPQDVKYFIDKLIWRAKRGKFKGKPER